MSPPRDRGQPKVLVVDDDRGLRFLARLSLEQAGFSVEEAEDGHAALLALMKDRVDILLLDVEMPGLSGFEVCRRLRESPAGQGIPVLMMTGLDDVESIERAYDSGATDFVVKPVNWQILGHRMRYMLRASWASADLRLSEAKLSKAQELAHLGWWEWDLESDRFTGSNEFFHILGVDPNAFGNSYGDYLHIVHAEDRNLVKGAIEEAIVQGASCSVDHRIVLPDGSERVVHEQVEVVAKRGDKALHMMGTIHDVTGRKRSEEQIRFLAYYDSLTGLPNRRFFEERVRLALEQSVRSKCPAAVLFLDLDRFKRINDTLGHNAGDQLLQEVGERLARSVRRQDCVTRMPEEQDDPVVARLGGDEFIILLNEIKKVDGAARVARRVLQALSAPFTIKGQQLFVTTSIGISVCPFDGEDSDTLLKNADTAMYFAKEQGRNNYQFYNDMMNATALERLTLESNMCRGLERGEFFLEYQPQVSLADGDIVGVEALVRWRTPEEGVIPPGRFIPLAEETGFIRPLGEWVLRHACSRAVTWSRMGLADLRVAVNVSGSQFEDPGFASTVTQILEETGQDPALLEIEVTESVLMADVKQAIVTLDELKAMGIAISIDDFGTGYSSLSYLKKLPIDAIKIDRSFVKDLPGDGDHAAITTAVLAMAKGLSLNVIAEGVETEEQRRFLQERGCQDMQGYLVSPALPETQLLAFVKRYQRETVLGAATQASAALAGAPA